MRRRINALICSFLCCLLLGLCSVVNVSAYTQNSERNSEEVYSVSFDIIGGNDVMPIGGWWGPYQGSFNCINGNLIPNYNQDKYYQMLVDCGINTITVTPNEYSGSKEYVFDALKLCEKYNIAYFVYDYLLQTMSDSTAMLNQMYEYINSPACVGIHLIDEPRASAFDSIGKIYDAYNQLGFENKYLYTNLLPSYASNLSGTSEAMTFATYVRQFAETVHPPFLSWDNYPFSEYGQGTSDMYELFNDLSVFRSVSNEYGIPFWGFIEAGGQHSDAGAEFVSAEYFPSEGEMIWNINLLLAYGCKSIQYFCLFQPENYSYSINDTRDFERNGLIGANGNKNRWYYYAQKANKQISAIDHILMNSANMGVIPVGSSLSMLVTGKEKLSAFRELVGYSDAGTYENGNPKAGYLIGCFDFFGNTALYVVNNSATEYQEVTLNFDGNYNYEIIQQAVSSTVSGRNVQLGLNPGEGVMLTIL